MGPGFVLLLCCLRPACPVAGSPLAWSSGGGEGPASFLLTSLVQSHLVSSNHKLPPPVIPSIPASRWLGSHCWGQPGQDLARSAGQRSLDLYLGLVGGKPLGKVRVLSSSTTPPTNHPVSGAGASAVWTSVAPCKLTAAVSQGGFYAGALGLKRPQGPSLASQQGAHLPPPLIPV